MYPVLEVSEEPSMAAAELMAAWEFRPELDAANGCQSLSSERSRLTMPLPALAVQLQQEGRMASAEESHRPNPYLKDDRQKVQTVRSTGAVYLYGPELDIVDTPEFQRLSGIKQLGTSYFVFRGAVHTRFEHSLGTLQQAQNIIDAVRKDPREGRTVDDRGQRLARLGALLHDLPHIPFGHTLEDEFDLLTRHDENQPRLNALLKDSAIGSILREALGDDEYELLLYVLDAVPPGKAEPEDKDERLVERLGEYAYVADIVANTVCADVLDYIVRDLSACGMPVAIGDRFLDFFAITPSSAPVKGNGNRMALRLDKRGMPRPDVESEVIKLLTYRYELAERVFFHHAKNAASVMIGRAVSLLDLNKADENFYGLSDDLLLTVLGTPKVGDALSLKMTKSDARRQSAARLGRLVGERKLYKLAYLGVSDDDRNLRATDIHARWSSPADRTALEAELAAKAGVGDGDVLVHLPTPKMMAKLAKVRVLLEDDTVTTFEEWEARHARRVQALNLAHQRLWRVAVYLHPHEASEQLSPGTKRLVAAAARDLFGLPSRYVEYEVDDSYFATVFDLFVEREGWPAGSRDRIVTEAAAAAAKPTGGTLTLDAAVETVRQVVRQHNGEERQAEPKEGDGSQGTLPGA